MWYIKKDTLEVADMTRKQAADLNKFLKSQQVWESGRDPNEIIHSWDYTQLKKQLDNEYNKALSDFQSFKKQFVEDNEFKIESFLEAWDKAVEEGDEKIIVEEIKIFNIPFKIDYDNGSLDCFEKEINFGCSDEGFGCMSCHIKNQNYFSNDIAEAAWLYKNNGVNLLKKLAEEHELKLQNFPDKPEKLIDYLRRQKK